ncbi:MAG: ribosome biogenesis GTPase Der [Acidobacteriota bacterium]|nr:ribosome biogenesis GTPase Der [Acidobacteriota bacterium]
MTTTPTVAVVGRPNVGKSTLFNRLLGSRRAIVHDQPGVTRDRIVARGEIVPSRPILLIDTGGLVPGDDPLGLGRQVELAMAESDLLLVVVDGDEGPVPADEVVIERVRRLGKPWLLVVNKGDTRRAREGVFEFHRLGAEPLLVSAEHGLGLAELREAILGRLPGEAVAEPPEPDLPTVAIVGRPNVGKSSLVNRLLGAERVLVSPRPGTTRDPVDCVVERDGKRYLLIDTAGIRRRARTTGAPEELAVLFARRQIERCQVALLLVDAAAGITSGDLAIAGAIWELGRAAVVGINKWDLLAPATRDELERGWPRLEELLGGAPRVNLSAASGRGIDRLFPALDRAAAALRQEIPTAELNRILQELASQHRPPVRAGKPWKLFYATQVAGIPPTFLLFANRTLPVGDGYRRYLEKRLRETFGYAGVPLRLVIRTRQAASGPARIR